MLRAAKSKTKDESPSISKKIIKISPVRHAKTFSQRFMGLMGVKKKELDYALVFHLAETGTLNASIHMLFMKTPIDVVWLDQNQRVVDSVESLRTWTINYTPKQPAKFIVEMPVGWIRAQKITNGTVLKW